MLPADRKTAIMLSSKQKLATNLTEQEVIDLINDAYKAGDCIVSIPCYAADPWIPGSPIEPFGVPVGNIDLIINLMRDENHVAVPGSELVIPQKRIHSLD